MRRSLAVLGLLTCLLWPSGAKAFQKPAPKDRVLPDFDSRLAALPAQARLAAGPAAERLDSLRSRLAHPLRLRAHPITGAARLLWAEGEPLSDPSPSPRAAARRFLQENASLLGLEGAGTDGLVLRREEPLAGGTLTRFVFDQVVEGTPVFGGVVVVHADRLSRVVKVAAGPLHRGRRQGEAAPVPALSAEEALARAVADVRPELTLTPRRRPAAAGVPGAIFEPGPLAEDARVELVWFPTSEGERLAFKARVVPSGFPQAYDIVVDAVSGDILYRRNRVRYAEGQGTVPQSDETQLADPRQPDEHPRGSNPSGPSDPPGGCPPPLGYVNRSLDAPFRDPGTVLAAGGRLRGNNTHVYRTSAGTFGALGTPDGPTWRFEYPLGSAASVETALFFSTNFAHDFFYDIGFDEAAGNFQSDNLGRGGLGGDPLTTLARADGRNNATFEPTPEGQSPIMSLFLFDGYGCWAEDLDGDGSPDLDGGYDADVVIHEYHHGVSWRLSPDFTGVEADAMGEGGGDFFAYSLSGNTELAEFSVPPFGIRGVNDKTYADFTCLFFFYCEPHDNGEIWANVLWDLREAFRADLVGGSEAAATAALHRLYLDGLALSPPSPTMLDLRDAMLQADLARHPAPTAVGGSENHCRMWTAFEGRGMGQNALDTNDTGDNSVVAGDGIPAACPQPLRVSLSAADAQAAEAGLDPGSFTVSRTGDTSADLTLLYTVGGTATPGADYEALTGSVTLPTGASTASIVVTPKDDPAYELPETVTVTLAPDPAYELKGPGSGTVTLSSDDLGSDLVVSALTVPSPSGAGLAVTVSDTTKNQGAGTAPASTTAFYFSANAALDAPDTFLGSRSLPAIAPGASSIGSTSLTIPPGAAAGSYYVLARAEADSAFLETNEANNTRIAQVVVGPDLAVTAFTAPVSAAPGGLLSVSDTTKNQGGGTAAASTTRFFVSTNTVLDAADLPLGDRTTPALAPGASSPQTTSLALPALPGGAYYLIARADGDAVVAETSETNNTRIAAIAVGSDLVVSALTVPSPTGAGLVVSVSDTTKNQGAGPAPASTTAFYFSTNTALDAADTFLASRSLPALAPGASSIGSTSLTIPAGAAAGSYYILARAEADSAFLETNEANNTRIAPVVVGPDLAVTAFTAPASAAPGGLLSVSDTTKNQGGGTAAASTTRFFLSTNTVLDAADLPLGDRPSPLLAPGASSPQTTSLTLPDLPGGAYYLIARADADAVVAETSETNNTRIAAIAIGPDLVVSALTVPSPTGAGLVVSVSDTTKNQGAGTAPASTTAFYFSTNAALDAADTFLAARSLPALAPGTSSVGSTSLTIPTGAVAGIYYILARAEADSDFLETSETNNTRLAQVVVGPDLIVSLLAAPASATAGATITVSDTTKNQGGGTTAATATRFFLSTNTVFDAADLPLGARAVDSLLPNAVEAASTPLTIPPGTASGSYYVLARADGDDLVAETSETNNVRIDSITISAAP